MAHMHFLQVCPLIYQALTYLKSHNKFYENICIAKNLSNKDIFTFSANAETENENENVSEKIISDN